MTGSLPEAKGGLYLHLPFCSAVCPYCDFAVVTARPDRRRLFVDRLLKEVRLWREEMSDWPAFDTVYLGGGTPSLLEDADLERILVALAEDLGVEDDAVLHMEANPEDVTPSRLETWRSFGVRFLSLGVQSFQDETLRYLGRRHTGEQAAGSVRHALESGLPTVSVDLMFGLPDRPIEAWRRDLGEATRLGPHHVSCYQLTIHEGTHFAKRRDRGRLVELSGEAQAVRYQRMHQHLGDHGYEAYEVSNFSRGSRHQSRHNRKYWNHTPYLGLGPSAHSYREGRRWWNLAGLEAWREALQDGRKPIEGGEVLDGDQLALEAILLALRTSRGLDLEGMRDRFGLDLGTENESRFRMWEERGYVCRRGPVLIPTVEGFCIADRLAAEVTWQSRTVPLEKERVV